MKQSHDPKRDAGAVGTEDALEATAKSYADSLHLDPETAELAAADSDARGDRKPGSDVVDVERAARARAEAAKK